MEKTIWYFIFDKYGNQSDGFEHYGAFKTQKEADDYIKNVLIPKYNNQNDFYTILLHC